MNRLFAPLILIGAASLVAPLAASAVTINWVPVGNPGNAADPITGSLFGAVNYDYRIDKYEVTNSQYVEFLNVNDPAGANGLGLYNGNMNINYTPGNAIGSKYSIISGTENKPVNYASWYDAARFANWLNNGQVSGATETGAYTLGPLGVGGIPTNGLSVTRNGGANVFLPSENEWYKAAFYNPATSSYFNYPTSSNGETVAEPPPGGSNSASISSAAGITDVGAYTGTKSPYGAFDMGGNVFQWTEALLNNNTFRGLGSAAYFNPPDALKSFNQPGYGGDPTQEFQSIGFRVASASAIPEPTTGVLAILACGAIWWRRKR